MSQMYDGYYPQQQMMNRPMYQVPLYQQQIPVYQMPPQQALQNNTPQGQPPQNGLVGRYIGDIQEVTASEVPMNGNFAVFPKKDMSEIVVKSWQPNGTIATICFAPVSSEGKGTGEQSVNESDKIALSIAESLTGGIMKRFDALEERIDALCKANEKTVLPKNKKGGDEQ